MYSYPFVKITILFTRSWHCYKVSKLLASIYGILVVSLIYVRKKSGMIRGFNRKFQENRLDLFVKWQLFSKLNIFGEMVGDLRYFYVDTIFNEHDIDF